MNLESKLLTGVLPWLQTVVLGWYDAAEVDGRGRVVMTDAILLVVMAVGVLIVELVLEVLTAVLAVVLGLVRWGGDDGESEVGGSLGGRMTGDDGDTNGGVQSQHL